MDENSPTCMRPSSVERVRMRGLPVTAPMVGFSSRWRIIQAMASTSRIESPSMHIRYSASVTWAAVVRPIALPWLDDWWITTSCGCRAANAFRHSPVRSLLPSLTAMMS